MRLILWILLVCMLLYAEKTDGADLFNNSDDRLITSIRRDLEEKATSWQFGLNGISGWPSDDTDAKYGFGIMLENDFLRPLVIHSNIGLCFSRFKTIFPGQRFLSFSADLDVLYRTNWLKIGPYIGGGLGIISNSYPTGRPASGYNAPYDENTPSEHMDFGSRTGLHLTMGMLYKISNRVSLMLDFRRSATRISCPVLVTRYPPGTTTQETRDYRIGGFIIRIGIVARLYK